MTGNPPNQTVNSRKILWILFASSSIVFLALLFWVFFESINAREDKSSSDTSFWGTIIAAVTSFVTSISTFVGLLFGWRKEKRETEKNSLEVRKLELELERANNELKKVNPKKKKKT